MPYGGKRATLCNHLMFAFFETVLDRIKPWLSRLLKGVAFFVLVGLAVIFFEWKALPWLASKDWATRFQIVPNLSERVTVIERRESVSITQDENIERMVSEYGSVVVGVLEESVASSNSLAVKLNQSVLGSGVWVTNDGLLVTYRSTEPSRTMNRYTVFLPDTQKKEAQIAGYDALTNLLYLRVEGVNTPSIAFANSIDIKPGRRAVLFSRESDARLEVTPNTIGSFDRSFNLNPQTVASSEKWEGVLGLGSPVEMWPLGSPALLANGEVGGILGQIRIDGVTRSFLIPSNVVRESLDRLIIGKTTRPTTGIYYLTITPALEQTLGLSSDRGALIYSPSERTGLSLIAGSPAARADLQFGDIIKSVNGSEVNLDLPLSVALGRFSAGDTVTLRVLRGEVEREILLSL